MNLSVNRRGYSVVAVVAEGEVVLTCAQDALDLMATARHLHGCDKLLLPKSAVCEDFFDLRTGIAGEVLQKYSNYRMRVAIVGDFSAYDSRALRDFIRESNRGGQVLFLPTLEEALEALHSV